MIAESPTRPILRYHGGKWRLAPWVIRHFPAHRIYVEPFGGAASVLMQKPRSFAEIYNDLDDEVVGVFRVLRDPVAAARLKDLLLLTPFSRVEFEEAYVRSEDAVEQARRTIIKSFMGYGSTAIHAKSPRGMRTSASTWRDPSGFCPLGGWGTSRVNYTTGFRTGDHGETAKAVSFQPKSVRSGSTHATDWSRYPEMVSRFTERLAGVVIEHRPALEVVRQHDRADALFFVDPPYVHSTRNRRDRHGYAYEMTDDDHRELAETLHQVNGMVVLCGYPSILYDCELYADWRRVTRRTYADGAKERTEVLWINPAAAERLQPCLF